MNSLSRLFKYGACIFLVLFLVGCGTSNENSNEDEEPVSDSNTKEADSETEDLETVFAEADEAALEFYKAFYEFNVPVLYEMLPPKQQEEFLETASLGNSDKEKPIAFMVIDEDLEELIDSEKFLEIKDNYKGEIKDTPRQGRIGFDKDIFRNFEDNEDYDMIRLANAYEETGEVIYYVSPLDELGNNSNNFLATKQSPEGKWKVRIISSSEVGIDPSETEEMEQSGVRLHPVENEEDEDNYGF
ncbi:MULTISPECIES: hypothetical protein [Oceanobacillus]|uniref:hypothetical protein n=1 Tax=Oceanobacillus TaxID=182709 RepID=UPI0005959D16|nr:MULTISPECIES: hypothetical protein [Oceanobacillus]